MIHVSGKHLLAYCLLVWTTGGCNLEDHSRPAPAPVPNTTDGPKEEIPINYRNVDILLSASEAYFLHFGTLPTSSDDLKRLPEANGLVLSELNRYPAKLRFSEPKDRECKIFFEWRPSERRPAIHSLPFVVPDPSLTVRNACLISGDTFKPRMVQRRKIAIDTIAMLANSWAGPATFSAEKLATTLRDEIYVPTEHGSFELTLLRDLTVSTDELAITILDRKESMKYTYSKRPEDFKKVEIE